MGEVEDLTTISMDQFRGEGEKEEEREREEEVEKEEPAYAEISIPTEMLIALVGGALSMRYLPDGAAVKAFHEKYREEVRKIIESFGLKEVFDEILASTLCFKIEKSEMLEIPMPAWVGVVVVISVLVVSGFVIMIPTAKGKGKEEKGKEKEKKGGEGESKT